MFGLLVEALGLHAIQRSQFTVQNYPDHVARQCSHVLLEAQFGFYRSSNSAEIDLLIDVPGLGLMAVEVKKGIHTKPRRGFTALTKTCNQPTNFCCTTGQMPRLTRSAMG